MFFLAAVVWIFWVLILLSFCGWCQHLFSVAHVYDMWYSGDMAKLSFTPTQDSNSDPGYRVYANENLPEYGIEAGTTGGFIYESVTVDDDSWVGEGTIVSGDSVITNSRVDGLDTTIHDSFITDSHVKNSKLVDATVTKSNVFNTPITNGIVNDSNLTYADVLDTIIDDSTMYGATLTPVLVHETPKIVGAYVTGYSQLLTFADDRIALYMGEGYTAYISHHDLGVLPVWEVENRLKNDTILNNVGEDDAATLERVCAAAGPLTQLWGA